MSRGTDVQSANPQPTREAPAPGRAGHGFSARLSGAALFDLIQIECLSRARKAVRVTSAGRGAMLYFRDGRLVHAAAGRIAGEAAVAQVLAWGEGLFEPCEAPWPALETISGNLEGVLLRAAQAIDEGRPPVERSPAAPHSANVLPLPLPENKTEKLETMTKPRLLPPGLAGADVELYVRLSATGEVVEHQGAGGEDFSDAVAYSAQLMDLIGELLGLDRFASMELSFEQGKCLMHREADGGVLALKPGRSTGFEALRQKLGLGG